MQIRIRNLFSVTAAAFLGTALALSLGADKPEAAVAPRYSVQLIGPFTHVIDNQTNKDWVYINDEKSSKLLGMIDLTQAGKPELKSIKSDELIKP